MYANVNLLYLNQAFLSNLDSECTRHPTNGRSPLWARPIPIPGSNCEISNTASYFFSEYDGQQVPLQRRTWVIQERFSAVRTLFFGGSGLDWECLRCQTSEWNMNGVFEPPNTNYKHNIHNALDPVVNDPIATVRYKDDFLHIWGVVRKLYTCAELTHESDKPVAMIGMAKLLADRSGFTNWHETWIDLASADLCWKVSYVDEDSKLVEKLPSWSWLLVETRATPSISENKYYISWRESPEAYCIPPQEQMIGNGRFRVGSPVDIVIRNVMRTTLHKRTNMELTLRTSSRRVHLPSGDCFTLEAPPQDMLEFHSKGRTYHEDSSEDEDGKRIGETVLIAAPADETGVFRRLGVFKHWVFTDVSMSDYWAYGGGPDPRHLPRSPFAGLEEVGWVHLI